MIGVFCFESTWTGWTDEQLMREVEGLRGLGVTAIVTETIDPPLRLMQATADAGLETHVSVPCFSAHAYPSLIEGLDVHPVAVDGRPRRQMEWYGGLIPTNEAYNRALLDRIRALAEARPAGVILDFIRWPLHWELELRASTPEPEEASFDATSIEAFGRWLDGRRLPRGGRLDAERLLGPLREPWTEFKCEVITNVACDAAESVRAVDPTISVGAFIIPAAREDRRRLLGQDVEALSRCLDVLYPMTYHAILEEGPELVGRVTAEVSERSQARVIPVVQVTADPAVADPWDWGPEFSPSELTEIITAARAVAPGTVLFAFEGLDERRREALLAALDRLVADHDTIGVVGCGQPSSERVYVRMTPFAVSAT